MKPTLIASSPLDLRRNRHSHDDHDGGLIHDLERLAQLQARRRVLGWMTGGTLALLGGCGDGSGSGSIAASTSTAAGASGTTSTTTTPASNGTCIADPEETAGPYPADGSNTINGSVSNVLLDSGVVRSDLRSSFGGFSGTAAGVPLALTLSVLNSNNLCTPLLDCAVYLWHCTRDGAYSLYSAGVQDQNFLRGVQVTDANGLVTFQTIFPGCYAGRYPHLHFEVYLSLSMATLYTNRLLTSQMALPRDACSTVYGSATGYGASASNLAGVTLQSDGIFGDNTAAQIAQQTISLSGSVSTGYVGSIVIGVPA